MFRRLAAAAQHGRWLQYVTVRAEYMAQHKAKKRMLDRLREFCRLVKFEREVEC